MTECKSRPVSHRNSMSGAPGLDERLDRSLLVPDKAPRQVGWTACLLAIAGSPKRVQARMVTVVLEVLSP